MKRTFVLVLVALAAVAVLAGLVYIVLVASHLSQSAATTVQGPTTRRLWATTASVLALISVVIGGLAMVRSAKFGTAARLHDELLRPGCRDRRLRRKDGGERREDGGAEEGAEAHARAEGVREARSYWPRGRSAMCVRRETRPSVARSGAGVAARRGSCALGSHDWAAAPSA